MARTNGTIKNIKNKLFCGDCVEVINNIFPDDCVDLVVTSPPYDDLRHYGGGFELDKKALINELYRVVKPGGVVIWVCGDATHKGTESCTSFKTALYFRKVGFLLYDTMIYSKNSLPLNHRRYEQDFEYIFVFSKGIPKTFNPIMIPCDWPEKPTSRKNSYFSVTDERNRRAESGRKRKPPKENKIHGNIWRYSVGKHHSTADEIAFKHPAIFPEKLVEDNINSWSNPGDFVLDPMAGSGTVLKMAKILKRDYCGIELKREYCDIIRERMKAIKQC